MGRVMGRVMGRGRGRARGRVRVRPEWLDLLLKVERDHGLGTPPG